MKQLALTIQSREDAGRGPCRRLRASGKVPAVLYGDSGSRSIAVNESALRQLLRSLRGSVALIELTDEKAQKTLSVFKDIQRDPVTDQFVHVDFREVAYGKLMTVNLPVRVVGESTGVKNENGVLEVVAHALEVRCLPKDMPEFITVDVADLRAGHAIHIKDLQAIEGVSFVGDPVAVVVACTAPEAAEEVAETVAPVVAEA